MGDDVKISFVVAAYNIEKYVKFCLSSLIPFLKSGHEIIVVDDGSKDSTLSILKSYKKLYPVIKIIATHNQGLSAARNLGMCYVTKEYIWFIDGDDSVDSNYLKLIEETLSQRKYDILFFGRKMVYSRCTKFIPLGIEQTDYNSGDEAIVDLIRKRWFRTNAWDKIFLTNLIKSNKLLFEPNLLYEDMLFVVKAFVFAQKVKVLDIYPYNYSCENLSSITHIPRKKDLDVLVNIEILSLFLKQRKSGFNYDSPEAKFLIYNWVSSCLMNKYVYRPKESVMASHIFEEVVNHWLFKECIYFCSRTFTFGMRSFCFANLLRFSKRGYKLLLALALSIQKNLVRSAG